MRIEKRGLLLIPFLATLCSCCPITCGLCSPDYLVWTSETDDDVQPGWFFGYSIKKCQTAADSSNNNLQVSYYHISSFEYLFQPEDDLEIVLTTNETNESTVVIDNFRDSEYSVKHNSDFDYHLDDESGTVSLRFSLKGESSVTILVQKYLHYCSIDNKIVYSDVDADICS